MNTSKLISFYAGTWIILTSFSTFAFLGLTTFLSREINLRSIPAVSPRTSEVGMIPVIDLLIYFLVFFSLYYVFVRLKIKPIFSTNFIYDARRGKYINVWKLYQIALTLSLLTVIQFSIVGFLVSNISFLFFYVNILSFLIHSFGIIFFSVPIFLYMAVKSL